MSRKPTTPKRRSRAVAARSYDERYVSFVDILGFSSIVARSENDAVLVGNLSKALHGINQRVANARSTELGMEATAFSDNVVLSVPGSAEGLLYMLQILGDLSMDLLSLNMLFRGAVVKGKLLHTTGAVFGPALIDAYKLETTVSFHPRIMVSGEVYQDAASGPFQPQKLIPKYIVTDQHDVPYLNPFARWHGMKGDWPADALEKLVTLQTIIATGLIENATLPPVAEKYKWIARRLNSFVRAAGLSDKIAEIKLEDAGTGT
jgi:hypothetical protein